MSKVLIDNDEEGDDVPRLQYATGHEHDLVLPRASVDDLARLRAVNQELVTALRDLHDAIDAVDARGDPLWIVDCRLLRAAHRALQHAETRTP